ncbi:23600_t:CDS:1, partial [Racocetra persica]
NGQVQDSIIGSYELTRNIVKIDKYHAMALFANTGLDPPRFDQHSSDYLFTGREIVSMLFSETPINYERAPSSFNDLYAPYIQYDPTEVLTVIKDGQMLRGVLDKKSVGAKATGGIFHLIGREYGSQKALDMIFALQQIVLQFIIYRGFTVGPVDLLTSSSASSKLQELVASALLESRIITDRLIGGEIIPPIGYTVHEYYEKLQINALKVDEQEMLRVILGSISPNSNGFFRMIASGAKGNNPNLIHVVGNIGQTAINGERIREQFAFRRTMPYFPRFSTDPSAYGFVEHSYMDGMTLPEFFFQGMNGRYDLINKALSTATTGYFM